jgi:lysophospholipase L1-like esterase
MTRLTLISHIRSTSLIRTTLTFALASTLLTMGCNGGGKSERDPKEEEETTAAPESSETAKNSAESSSPSTPAPAPAITDIGNNNPNLLVAIGDSLTAGSNVSGPSYPARLSGILGKTVQNRGVPGATSSAAGGQASGALAAKPSHLLILFGTNDVFREVPPDTVAANVRAAVNAAKANKTIPVVGTLPPNLRSDFQQGIVNAYNGRLKGVGARVADISREFGSGAGLIQDDGFHPNDQGTAIIAFAFANAVRR